MVVFLAVLSALQCANPWNYGDPNANGGCKFDESSEVINGIPGSFCAPNCLAGNSCPQSFPPGVPFQTKGQCVLEINGSTTPTLCVLICSPSTSGSCGSSPYVSCEAIQGVGVCTYADHAPDPVASSSPTHTPTNSPSSSLTATPSPTPTDTLSSSHTPTPSPTPSPTSTKTVLLSSLTPSPSPKATFATPTLTNLATATTTPTASPLPLPPQPPASPLSSSPFNTLTIVSLTMSSLLLFSLVGVVGVYRNWFAFCYQPHGFAGSGEETEYTQMPQFAVQ